MEMKVDEERVTRLLRIIEDNIEAEIQVTREAMELSCQNPLRPVKPAKVSRKLERELRKELSAEERMELGRRKKAKARAYWEAGDNYRKHLWGGW
jgi:hypothetical protein